MKHVISILLLVAFFLNAPAHPADEPSKDKSPVKNDVSSNLEIIAKLEKEKLHLSKLLARIYENLGKTDQATAKYLAAWSLAPESTHIAAKLFEHYKKNKQWNKLVEICEFLTVSNANNYYYNLWLGICYLEMGKKEKARKQWDKYIELNGQNAYTFEQLAHGLKNENYNEEALKILEHGISKYPDSSRLHYEKGLVQLQQKLYKEALKTFEKALTLADENTPLHSIKTMIISTYKKMGTLDKLINQSESELATIDSNLTKFYWIMVLHFENKSPNEALKFCNKLIELIPANDKEKMIIKLAIEKKAQIIKATTKKDKAKNQGEAEKNAP